MSIASFWEMAIKVSIGKLDLKKSLPTLMQSFLEHDFRIQPIHFEHTLLVSTMPLHHRDPFDRMLLAQALVEDMMLVSNEVIFDNYGMNDFDETYPTCLYSLCHTAASIALNAGNNSLLCFCTK